ncbi:Pimeloyl-ACP methyl ester carboxylesterase [Natronoarchaeum philippinense]|uniref:Pimeloyl-ACP methyl ester carboxylesterase n=1 Tax=Natronoarchaeum philippinense TaxID=558529 RepID=A0A285N3A8_NATPI|nr:alpha/beta hydrolase [Natronoarchaeum philippinense]SNZ03932.1 Pimeloyl-ACP methyl ester carboxylesterase [Natronoarchaeum philippinense]
MGLEADVLPVESPTSTIRAVDGIDLHVVAAGREDDPVVVLLHGFPDCFYGWRHQIQPLVDAGYRVLVPDQRGYNLSDKPSGLGAYRLGRLSADIAALIESEGEDSAHVVGHDWGAMVAWDLALRRPEYLDRLGILNVPHPAAFRSTLRSSPRQLLRSWYVFAFQLPRVPEWALSRSEFAGMTEALEETANPATFDSRDFERYRKIWAEPGALTGMLNWYRAIARRPDIPARERVDAPTLIGWGEQDTALVPELAEKSARYCEDVRVERFPERSHWVHVEAPEAVNDLLIGHLDK